MRALTDAPEWREMLPAQRRVFKRLAQKADDDGVVRLQMSTRKLAEYTDHSPETVRKMLRWLERDGKIRRSPGTGRERSRYAIPPVWGMAILDPLTPAPGTSAASASAVTPNASTLSAPSPVSSATAKSSGDGTMLPTGNDARWCPAARERGYPHAGRRCCGQTTRQLKAAEQRAARERAAEQEQAQRDADRRQLQLDEQGRVPTIDRGLALVREQLRPARGSSRVNGDPASNGA